MKYFITIVLICIVILLTKITFTPQKSEGKLQQEEYEQSMKEYEKTFMNIEIKKLKSYKQLNNLKMDKEIEQIKQEIDQIFSGESENTIETEPLYKNLQNIFLNQPPN